jgi:NAD(P)-dependent dehydrogenase (short-subunit alcohol dehydrogenase family)
VPIPKEKYMFGAFKEGLLAGKVAFITGGSSGINLGIAEAFVKAGAKVVINGRNVEKLEGAVKALQAHGTAMGVPADVRNYDAVAQAFQQAHDAYGEIDILVCGAAGNFPAPALGMSSNGFKAVMDIDVLGTFNACRAGFEHFRKPGASIINISAPQAFLPTAFQAHVCAAKAGVDMLTRVLAIEWGGSGVRINAVTPGPIEGTEGMSRLVPDPQVRQKLATTLPAQRLGTPQDIAAFCLFLASDAASFVTGGIFLCDGGQSLLGSGLLQQVMGV